MAEKILPLIALVDVWDTTCSIIVVLIDILKPHLIFIQVEMLSTESDKPTFFRFIEREFLLIYDNIADLFPIEIDM